jgi:hypothetical protein
MPSWNLPTILSDARGAVSFEIPVVRRQVAVGDLRSVMFFHCRFPGYQAEAQAVVEYREATGSNIQTLVIDA